MSVKNLESENNKEYQNINVTTVEKIDTFGARLAVGNYVCDFKDNPITPSSQNVVISTYAGYVECINNPSLLVSEQLGISLTLGPVFVPLFDAEFGVLHITMVYLDDPTNYALDVGVTYLPLFIPQQVAFFIFTNKELVTFPENQTFGFFYYIISGKPL